MKIARIIIAIVLTIVLAFISSMNSRGRPEYVEHSEYGFTFQMTTVPKAFENEQARISLHITGPTEPGLRMIFRQSEDAQMDVRRYGSMPLSLEDSASGRYYVDVATGKRGGKLYYYFEIRDMVGGVRASFQPDKNRPFTLKYIGHVPVSVLIGHIGLMFATVFFMALGFLHALGLVRGGGNPRPMAAMYFWAAVCTFLGGYPLGFAMNHYAFGTIWEGVPFGTDATDNKTQLLFVALLFMVLSSLGSLTKGRFGRDLFSPKSLGYFGIGVFALKLGIYLIPHSIQFSRGLTHGVCYSFIDLIALIFVAGLISSASHLKSHASRAQKKPKRV
jgi:hypothetical protein